MRRFTVYLPKQNSNKMKAVVHKTYTVAGVCRGANMYPTTGPLVWFVGA